MSQHLAKLAVLFADMCDSTALYDQLGDDCARRVVAQFIMDMSGEVSRHQGLVIKTVGDKIVCTFTNAEDALKAACAMQRAVAHGIYEGDQKVNARIGFHYGDVICEDGDIFGDTVNVASRVLEITRAHQIMTTLAAVNNLDPDLRGQLKQVMRAEFKGKQGEYEIFVVTWDAEDMLTTRVGTPAFRKPSPSNNQLILKYHGHTVVVNNDRRSVTLGREKSCDIVVAGEYVSREHARIELHSDKFTLIDQSTNATYIRNKDGDVFHVGREEMTLQGSGTISLGESFASAPVNLIGYTITAGAAVVVA